MPGPAERRLSIQHPASLGSIVQRSLPAAAVVALVAYSAFMSTAHAQVNVEGLRKELTRDGLLGKLNGSITTYEGNTVGLELGATGLIGWRQAPHLAYLSASANYSHLGGALQVANGFAHFRYDYALRDWISAELFVQGESDRFRRLRLRTLLGAGPRFALVDTDTVGVFYGISYMYEHDALDPATLPVRPASVQRLNNYASLVLVLDPGRATLSNTVYAQPRFDNFRDLRLLESFALDLTVTGRLIAGLHATLGYESPVRRPVKSADVIVKNTLGLLF